MLENVGRKVILIVVLLAVSLGLLLLQDRPFQLGLDLQGGTRLVYRFDFDAAIARGDLDANEDRAAVLAETVAITRNRVDPTGTLEPVIRTEGKDRMVIELPGTAGQGVVEAQSALAEPLDATQSGMLVLEDAKEFPLTGVVAIGEEEIRYEGRDGNRLLIEKRAHNGKSAAHENGASVRLVNADAIRAAIENLGELSFRLVAEDRHLRELGTDMATEEKKLRDWVAANPGVPIVAFNALPPEQGGPHAGLRWYPNHPEGEDDLRPEVDRAMAVMVPAPAEDFRGQDIARVHPSSDSLGYPAVGFEIRADRVGDFADFTGENEGRFMAIILNDEIRSFPRLESKLVGGGIIEGRFQDEEVKNLITVLRSGSLKLKPTLEHDERVGATLGDDYVRRGVYSSVVALIVVVAFMILYYRRLGVFAALALLTNLLMFLGGLAFLNATLTLPGIAGIILTVGMAVDANILIFDRLREEAEKGRNIKQASKAGFDKATSAIIDANVTTFISALILYHFGTGPVRGFAVTLMVGILTSVFAALLTTRVFVHWALSKGAQRFPMGRWMADANFDFLGKTKVALTVSSLLIVAGLALFLTTPDEQKLGTDFTGGIEAQIQTAEAQPTDTIRAAVRGIAAGGIGESGEVRPVLNSEQEDGKYTQFRVTFKTVGDEIAEGESLRPQLQEGLKDILLDDPIQVNAKEEGGVAKVDGRLYFQDVHPEADIAARLGEVGLNEVQVAVADRKGAYTLTATTAFGRSPAELTQAIETAFRTARDSGGEAFVLAEPIPVWSQVGPQVVGELRDKALFALGLSLFVTVIYIRVRFAEYSYGIAAVVAVIHDVLITLAALTLGNRLGIVNGELNLAMIAVFLTIIGYSINDTIVIFDRVRENLPRMKAPLREVLNTSVNETFSRTITTSLTVFLAVLVQYLFNLGTGNVLESIGFAMLVGTITGSYSTIFIANPVFLWLENRRGRLKPGSSLDQPKKKDDDQDDPTMVAAKV